MILRILTLSLLGLSALHGAEESALADVRAADDERVRATLAADLARLTAILSDDLHYGHSTGAVDTKASYIDSLVSGRTKYIVIDYQERNFTFPVPGIALMTGRVHIKASSVLGASDGFLRLLAVWREEKGQWRFLAWQSCKLPPASKP